MSKCPFHDDSAGHTQDGEIEAIHCAACGDYRISKTALDLLQGTKLPEGWAQLVTRRALVSTRDTRMLQA
ncbi:MAG: hypothetical protein AAF993_09170 [Pseudomonadota bacterium]